jgi:hypothetical protein
MNLIQAKARAAAVVAQSSRTVALLAYVTPSGTYSRAVPLNVLIPSKGTPEYAAIEADVSRMEARKVTIPAGIEREHEIAQMPVPGPNDPCWCGSGKNTKNVIVPRRGGSLRDPAKPCRNYRDSLLFLQLIYSDYGLQ